MAYWHAIALAGAVFAATSIDDFVFVVCLLSGAGGRPAPVILAKLLNALLVVAIAALLALGVGRPVGGSGGLLTAGPAIVLGIFRLATAMAARRGADGRAVPPQTASQSFRNCFLVFAAGSLDNVVGYAALFCGSAAPVLAVSVGVILGLSAALCAVAYRVATARSPLFRRGQAWRLDGLVPCLLICLGIRNLAAAYL